jgi:hypothetical protein
MISGDFYWFSPLIGDQRRHLWVVRMACEINQKSNNGENRNSNKDRMNLNNRI